MHPIHCPRLSDPGHTSLVMKDRKNQGGTAGRNLWEMDIFPARISAHFPSETVKRILPNPTVYRYSTFSQWILTAPSLRISGSKHSSLQIVAPVQRTGIRKTTSLRHPHSHTSFQKQVNQKLHVNGWSHNLFCWLCRGMEDPSQHQGNQGTFRVEGKIGKLFAAHHHTSSRCKNRSIPLLACCFAILAFTWHQARIHHTSLQGLNGLSHLWLWSADQII